MPKRKKTQKRAVVKKMWYLPEYNSPTFLLLLAFVLLILLLLVAKIIY